MTAEEVIIKLILPAGGVLGGVVAMFWRIIAKHHNHTEEKLEACEVQHKETTDTLILLKGEVGELKGRQDGIEKMSADVLDEIRKLEKRND